MSEPKAGTPRVRSAAFAGTLVLTTLWGVGQVTRDAGRLTGLCFYIPSAPLAGALVGFGGLLAARGRRRAAVLAAGLALAPLGVVVVENRGGGPQPRAAGKTLRLVHWNVGGALDRPAVRAALVDRRADFYALSEVGAGRSVEPLRAALGPDYQARVFGNMAVVGRGAVQTRGWLLGRGRTRVQGVEWSCAGQTFSVLVVDLPSNPLIPRAPMLDAVVNLIARDRPDLVVGDFNAPRRSRALDRLPAGYRHAYDSSGSGWGYTWPVPVPVYAIDQCIHSGRIAPVRYALWSSIRSDHRGQVFDFARADGGGMSTDRFPSAPFHRL